MDELNQKGLLLFLFVCVISLGITSCKVTPPKYPTAMQQMSSTLQEGIIINKQIAKNSARLPQSVSDALLPPIDSHVKPINQLTQRRFDIVADKMPSKVFFMGLIDGTSYNLIVDPTIEGTISLNLKNVTVEEAMEAVRDMYGYEYRKTSYGFEIIPPELETQLFNVNYLDVVRTGKSVTEIVSGQVSERVGTVSVGGSTGSSSTSSASLSGQSSPVSSSRVDTRSEANFWRSLEQTLKQIVPDEKGRSIVLNAQAGVVAVRAFPNELHQVTRYLDRIQANLRRQIIIEAKILEVQLNDTFDSGIDWSLLGNPAEGLASISQSSLKGNNTLGTFDSIFTLQTKGSFRALVEFLQTQGNVQTLSNPRISTVNNQKAVIKVGQDEFFVTGVSTTNSVVGTNTLPSQNVDLTPFFSGITLDVTPQISKDGMVILHIHPSVSTVTEQQKRIVLGSSGTSAPNILSLPLAKSTIRESDNIVRAKNGQIVVIGGLMQNLTSELIGGTPGLSRMPFLGSLFRRTHQASTKSELVILLRPILVNNRIWTESLQREDLDMRRANRNFHAGGLPEIFGNTGELTGA
jgi:MSHA biogenesis protein MshL